MGFLCNSTRGKSTRGGVAERVGKRGGAPLLCWAQSALAMAAVCLEPMLGGQVFAAATASHPVGHMGRSLTRIADRHPKAVEITPWEAAERGRDAFEATVESARTRAEYARATDRFRAIYHANPRDAHAPEAINAVAELLAEAGRDLRDRKSFEAAVGQYEFLRTQYPGSSLRVGALLAEGQIEENDLRDAAAARDRYELLLRTYPRSALAEQARAGLASLRGTGGERGGGMGGVSAGPPGDGQDPRPTGAGVSHGSGAGKMGRAGTQPAAPIVRGTASTGVAGAAGVGPVRSAAVAQAAGMPGTMPETMRETMRGVQLPLPPPRQVAHRAGPLASVSGIRHWSTATYTRVAIDLGNGMGDGVGNEVEYEAARVPSPDRIFFDLHGARIAQELLGKSFAVTDDGFLKRIRVAQSSSDVARVVLDVNDVTEYSAFLLPNPSRLIIDIHGKSKAAGATPYASVDSPAPRAVTVPNTRAMHAGSPTDVNTLSDQPGKVEATSTPTSQPIAATVEGRAEEGRTGEGRTGEGRAGEGRLGESGSGLPAMPTTGAGETGAARGNGSAATRGGVASQPAASGSDGRVVGDASPVVTARAVAAGRRLGKKGSKAQAVADARVVGDPAAPARAAVKTADGQTSLVRALGLKINRIVIDAGHGGHDSGTLGADGIQEKDVVLDVALRLGKLLHDRLGAEVIYTRSDDTFIPLETRTAIANKAQADLFLSIHANSSPDSSARGVETYYLNFTQQADALEVAARENAVSGQSLHQLSDLVRKITLKDKIAESREFATDVETSLYAGLARGNDGLKNRGVKKAPFAVLIGANMPSILAEISFVTNPRDAAQLREPEYKERVAESLFKGVARYVGSLSGAEAPGAPTERAAAGQ